MNRETLTLGSPRTSRHGLPGWWLRDGVIRTVQVLAPFLMLVFLTFTASDVNAQQRGGYKIVVNASNPVAALTADQVARLFQKKVTRWDNGQTVVPVDLPEDSRVRDRFTQDVHGRSVGAIKGYWQRQIFSGRGVPPVEKASPQEVVTYVAANANAIGYVPADMSTGPDVKAVRLSR